jgi:hypothetical protein
MNRKIFLVVMAILIVFIVFDPFKSLCNSGSEIRKYYVDKEAINEINAYVAENYKSPAEYITSQFKTKRIVMLGEYRYISQQIKFVQDLIPKLYDKGIRFLGIEYALLGDQEKIDTLLTSDEYDPELTHEIMFNYMPIWGYQEYADIYKSAWELNNSLPEGSPPFRIIALSPKQENQYIESQKDAEDPEILHKVLAHGIPDEVMADTVIEKIIEEGEKVLLYTSYERSFSSYISTEYTKKMNEMGFNENRRMGNILYDQLGNDVWSVFIHSPVPDSAAKFGLSYPVNGTMSSLIDRLPEGKKAVGFDLRDMSWGDIPVYNPRFNKGYDDLEIQNVWDGYILLGYHIDQYTGAAAIENFITEENIATAIKYFPGPSPGEVSAEEMNEFIAGITANMIQIFEKF